MQPFHLGTSAVSTQAYQTESIIDIDFETRLSITNFCLKISGIKGNDENMLRVCWQPKLPDVCLRPSA